MIAGACVLAIFKGMTVPGVNTNVTEAVMLGTPAYNADALSMGKAIFIEAMMTVMLVFVNFGTAVDPRARKIGGFGIGLAVAALILMGGPLTGASMNPARTLGTGLVAAMSGNFADFWLQQPAYWIGPIIGAVAAGLIYDAFLMEKKPQ